MDYQTADYGFSVETYDLPSYSSGVNDQGEALYELDGIEMTKAQAEDFKATTPSPYRTPFFQA